MSRKDELELKMLRRGVIGVVATVALLVLGSILFFSFEDVGADEIAVAQPPTGTLEVWSKPGWRWAPMARITTYKKSEQYEFRATKGPRGRANVSNCIPTRFNDQGSANICGTLSFDLPTDERTMLTLHKKFRSMTGIKNRLVRPAVVKSVYNSGPLMSSKESAGKMRGDLIRFVQEQATKGIYKTKTVDKEVEDLTVPPVKQILTRKEPKLDDKGQPVLDENGKPVMVNKTHTKIVPAKKRVQIVQPIIIKGKNAVQEVSTVSANGIRVYNITIERIVYEHKVQEQIDRQRNMTMQIQTKIAEAAAAKQQAVTAEQKGKAAAAKAKWEEERKKATAVTKAEASRAVAKLDLEKAKLEAQAKLTRAKADADARKMVLQADGALKQKLDAYVKVQMAWASAVSKQKWVPNVQMGSGASGINGFQGFMQVLMAKNAQDLAVQPNPR